MLAVATAQRLGREKDRVSPVLSALSEASVREQHVLSGHRVLADLHKVTSHPRKFGWDSGLQ